jgi:hypothetical protein
MLLEVKQRLKEVDV